MQERVILFASSIRLSTSRYTRNISRAQIWVTLLVTTSYGYSLRANYITKVAKLEYRHGSGNQAKESNQFSADCPGIRRCQWARRSSYKRSTIPSWKGSSIRRFSSSSILTISVLVPLFDQVTPLTSSIQQNGHSNSCSRGYPRSSSLAKRWGLYRLPERQAWLLLRYPCDLCTSTNSTYSLIANASMRDLFSENEESKRWSALAWHISLRCHKL